MEWNKSMNEKIYCRIRRVRAVLLTFFLTAAVVLTDAQSIREKEYEKTEIIYCIGDSITYGSGLGTNDSKQKYWDAERYEEQYLALIDELHNLPGHPYLYLMAPPEAFPAEEGEILYGINNDVIGGEIRNLVPDIAEQSGCGTLDLYALTQDHPEYFVDGIHPTEEGYALIAQMVADQIRADRNAGVW